MHNSREALLYNLESFLSILFNSFYHPTSIYDAEKKI
jgi:hypothetical protein